MWCPGSIGLGFFVGYVGRMLVVWWSNRIIRRYFEPFGLK